MQVCTLWSPESDTVHFHFLRYISNVCPANLRDPTVPTSPLLGLQVFTEGMYIDPRDPNSGLHASITRKYPLSHLSSPGDHASTGCYLSHAFTLRECWEIIVKFFPWGVIIVSSPS